MSDVKKPSVIIAAFKGVARWALAVVTCVTGAAAMVAVTLSLCFAVGKGLGVILGTTPSVWDSLGFGGLLFVAAGIIMTFTAFVIRAAVRQARRIEKKP